MSERHPDTATRGSAKPPRRDPAGAAPLPQGFAPHALPAADVLAALASGRQGLSRAEAQARLGRFGGNTLPAAVPPGVAVVFARQFRSPLVYVLLGAAVVSMAAQAWSDGAFIFAVLLVNALVGTYQEYRAERSAQALQGLISARAVVLRDGDVSSVPAEEVVPGDIVLLESGARVPADLRLFSEQNLTVDESLLTGESLPVAKDATRLYAAERPVAERANMAFAGTLVTAGRGSGVVVGTGLHTELGRIAQSVLGQAQVKPPLLLRMERFTRMIALAVGAAVLMVAVAAVALGMPLAEIFVLAVALAVSAIPEGLPVAITVALAVGMQRMASRRVIVRRLVAVESLGSCTCIATDKTGTLTVNQLTVRRLQLPDQPPWEVTGEGIVPEGRFVLPQAAQLAGREAIVDRLCRAVTLANEATLVHVDGAWSARGDSVDIALLVLAHKAGVNRAEAELAAPAIAAIPYESEAGYAASLNRYADGPRISVKGAAEKLLPMCTRMAIAGGDIALAAEAIAQQVQVLASEGHRVLAVADGPAALPADGSFSREQLRGLCLLGLVAMIDPLRPEARAAVDACRSAGIAVVMITGDHPATAQAIGRELGLVRDENDVVTAAALTQAPDEAGFDRLVGGARVFARVEPQMKLRIVQSLQRHGHLVAVTGDGVNDAPALRAAHVGVAMGCAGTDVARETADLVIADDNFASIVAGVEEGRIAYGNIRKVVFLLISTGAAELVLFALALAIGLPLPLLAVQLLWLNLVTNGIQDVALAFEPAEGDELARPPRPPRERLFNRLMVERVVLSAAVVGGLAFVVYRWLLLQGHALEDARNATLLLMVLFENVQVFNSRSETRSVLNHDPRRNRLLLFGVIGAQLLHIAAMYTPGLRAVLGIQPVAPDLWLQLFAVALVLLVAIELHKLIRRAASTQASPKR
ncbi:MAG: HAD-IC family P-type ATPase [Pseudomonadota bacterium]